MSGHILQAFVKSSKHVGEFLATGKIASPWRIQALSDWFEEAVVPQIVIYAIGQFGQPLLLVDEPLALLLKGSRLGFDELEGFRQRGKKFKGIRGVEK